MIKNFRKLSANILAGWFWFWFRYRECGCPGKFGYMLLMAVLTSNVMLVCVKPSLGVQCEVFETDLESKCLVKVVNSLRLFCGFMDNQSVFCVHSPTAIFLL